MQDITLSEKTISEAIKNQEIISFIYKEENRVVEPRLLWISKKWSLQLSAYQIDWFSESWEYFRKIYSLENIEKIITTGKKFDTKNIARLDKYNPNDTRMEKILIKI